MITLIDRLKPPLIPWFRKYLMIALLTTFLALYSGIAYASVPFFWDSIHVDLALQTNGDVLVTETQTYTFTSDHSSQRYRYIPLDRVDAITDIAVYENNHVLPVETGIKHNQQWISWSHDLNAPESHTFVLKYRAEGGVQFAGDTRLLHWRALFPDRSARIETGSVTVHLPNELAGEATLKSAGVSTTENRISSNTVAFSTRTPLEPQRFMDIKVEFPASILNLEMPQWQQAGANGSHGLSPAIIPASILIAVLVSIVLVQFTRSKCPECGKHTLKRFSHIRREPTRRREGSREIHESCKSCDYRDRYTQAIPRTSGSSGLSDYGAYPGSGYMGSSGGGYSGGGFSGGSDGGGFSGGGGGG